MPGKDTPATLNGTLLAEIKGLLGSNASFYHWLKISYTAHLPKKIQVPANTELNGVTFLQYINFKYEVEFATGKAKHTSFVILVFIRFLYLYNTGLIDIQYSNYFLTLLTFRDKSLDSIFFRATVPHLKCRE